MADTRRPSRRPVAGKSRPSSSGGRGLSLADAPAATRKAIAAGVRRLLKEHGLDDQLLQMQFKPRQRRARAAPAQRGAARKTRAATAAAATGAPAPCPPGEVRRVVCFVRKGTFVCAERCVPA